MRALMFAAVFAGLILSDIGSAQARIFEPQQDWWNAGRVCVASRNPPGRRWRSLPPRSCARAGHEQHAVEGGESMVTTAAAGWRAESKRKPALTPADA